MKEPEYAWLQGNRTQETISTRQLPWDESTLTTLSVQNLNSKEKEKDRPRVISLSPGKEEQGILMNSPTKTVAKAEGIDSGSYYPKVIGRRGCVEWE